MFVTPWPLQVQKLSWLNVGREQLPELSHRDWMGWLTVWDHHHHQVGEADPFSMWTKMRVRQIYLSKACRETRSHRDGGSSFNNIRGRGGVQWFWIKWNTGKFGKRGRYGRSMNGRKQAIRVLATWNVLAFHVKKLHSACNQHKWLQLVVWVVWQWWQFSSHQRSWVDWFLL